MEKTLESPLDCKEIKSITPKGINPEYSLEGLTVMVKFQYFGHFDAKRWLTGKGPDAGKDWRQKEKGVAEDEMVRQHH